MKNHFALALCSAFIASLGAASAADLPRRASVAAPVAAPVYNWTGFYVGVHAGWTSADIDAATTFLPVGGFASDPFGYSHDADGFMAGGQIGFNYQIANWVLGIEADISWTDVDGSAALGPMTFGGVVFPILAGSSHTSTFDMNWFGTVRGRLGFAANNLLVYVTGGLAFADIDYATATAYPATIPPSLFAGSAGHTRAGWTLGGGFEWGFTPNWSVKAEYLYYDLGDTTVVGVDPANPGLSVSTNFDNSGHILRVGVNYRFGWAGPVVARY